MEIKSTEIKIMPIGEIKPTPNNRNKHPQEQIDRLAEIIKYQGFRDALIVSNQSGFLVSGNGRLEAAKLAGLTHVPVSFQDFDSPEQEYAAAISLNSISLWAELDLAGINADIPDLGPDFDIDLLGIKNFELDVADKEGLTDEDEIPEAPAEPKTKLGDIYKLGNHRLMCGDSTSIDAVDKLMDGKKADMVFTDPPYGIGFKYNSHEDTTGDDYMDFCRDWFHILKQKSDFIIISTGWAYNKFWYSYDPKDCFYWICKNKITGGSISHFRKVEPIFIWGKPENRYDFDFWEQTTQIEAELKGKHTCPKPISLIESIISGCKNNGLILDVFGGSGTTMIAAEKTNRKAFLMELDPKYCDVIVERWENFTGQKAELLNGPQKETD